MNMSGQEMWTTFDEKRFTFSLQNRPNPELDRL